jgi:uncharacterized protein (DUF4213/DUF364 family)
MAAGDVLEHVRFPEDGSVAVVGAIIPVLQYLKRRGGIWWIIEQDPRVLKEDEMPHFVPFGDSEAVLPKADVLLVTGVTIVNHTLEAILEAARPGCEIAVMGPSASMLPEPFFTRGVRVMGGVLVKRADRLLDILAVGGSGYHFFGKAADQFTLIRNEAG